MIYNITIQHGATRKQIPFRGKDWEAIAKAQHCACTVDYVEVTDSTGCMVWDSEHGRHEGGY